MGQIYTGVFPDVKVFFQTLKSLRNYKVVQVILNPFEGNNRNFGMLVLMS